MAYDEDLAHRVRELLTGESAVDEKKMFGGLAFLIGGHMAVAASGQGGLLVRVEPSQLEMLLATTAASPMVMAGREVKGWIRVDGETVRTRRELARWVETATTCVRALPAKRDRLMRSPVKNRRRLD